MGAESPSILDHVRLTAAVIRGLEVENTTCAVGGTCPPHVRDVYEARAHAYGLAADMVENLAARLRHSPYGAASCR